MQSREVSQSEKSTVSSLPLTSHLLIQNMNIPMSQLEKQMHVVCYTVNESVSNFLGTAELLNDKKPQY